LHTPPVTFAASADTFFREGADAYHAGDYARAAQSFSESARQQPSSGALQNLGNTEWQRGQVGAAVLAWEQARWMDPWNEAARSNLRFARKAAQIEAPELTWYEVVSTWLPLNWWAWIAGFSLWLAVGLGMMPALLRWRKAAWPQVAAAFGLMVFLLSIPAHLGVHTRSRIGFILEKATPLRLTPTSEGQIFARLSPGDPARCERIRGNYLLLRTSHAVGWVERSQFGQLCPLK
jgi:tetratricopeptide (TPR) repeat protein